MNKSTAIAPNIAVKKQFFLIDAQDQVLGRLAGKIAWILMGKHKSSYTRHLDTGDHIIVINATKIRVTGRKATDKTYRFFSGYPSGLREVPYSKMAAEQPEYPLMHAVKGMLPKNSLGNHMLKKLRIYADANHEQKAQKPKELKLS